MCRTYTLTCPVCSTTAPQPYHCAALAARRHAQASTATNTDTDPNHAIQKPTITSCPTYTATACPTVPSISCQPPMAQACARHSCGRCGFKFWFTVDEEDDGGEEAVEDEGEERRRAAETKREESRGWKRRKWDRIEPA